MHSPELSTPDPSLCEQAENLGLFPPRDPFEWVGMSAELHQPFYGLTRGAGQVARAERAFSLPTQVLLLALPPRVQSRACMLGVCPSTVDVRDVMLKHLGRGSLNLDMWQSVRGCWSSSWGAVASV